MSTETCHGGDEFPPSEARKQETSERITINQPSGPPFAQSG